MDTDVLFEERILGNKVLRLLKEMGIENRIRRFISYERPEGLIDNERFSLLMPYSMRQGDEVTIRRMMEEEEPGSVVVRNLEELGFLRDTGYKGRITADASLYTFNSLSSAVLRSSGVTEDTVPFELNLHEMKERGIGSSVLPVYGRTPLMVSAQCTFRTSAGKCGRKPGGFMSVLSDRKNVDFPVRAECDFCYNVIYNSLPLCLFMEREEIMRLSPAAVRLDFTDERAEDAAEIIKTAVTVFDREGERQDLSDLIKNSVPRYTRGHFRKGVD